MLFNALTKKQLWLGIPENWIYVTIIAALLAMYGTFAFSGSGALKAFLLVLISTWLFGWHQTSKDVDWFEIFLTRFFKIANKSKSPANKYLL